MEMGLRLMAQNVINELKSPGLVIGVQKGGDRQVIVAAGVRNVATGDRMRTDEKFRIGSVTKHFIALCALQLVGEGKLSLEDPLEKWLSVELSKYLKKIDGKKITVRHLLNHTSGIVNYSDDLDALYKVYHTPPGHPFDAPKDLLVLTDKLQPPHAQPGNFSYSNTNYALLAMIATKADGISNYDWAAMVRNRILGPLGMNNTSIPTTGDQTIPGGQQHGYINWPRFFVVSAAECASYLRPPCHHCQVPLPPCEDKDIEFTNHDTSGAWAAGAIISTAGDLLKLLNAEMRGNLLPPAQLAEQQNFFDPKDPKRPTLRVGLGIFREGPSNLIGHYGAISGFNASVQYQKDKDVAIVVLSNRSSVDGKNIQPLPQYVFNSYFNYPSGRSGTPSVPPYKAPPAPPAGKHTPGATFHFPPDY
jgi:D-alanyl-D-alanine carboxypeptidase